MAKSPVNRGVSAWNKARERYQQLQVVLDGMGSDAPVVIQKNTDIAIAG